MHTYLHTDTNTVTSTHTHTHTHTYTHTYLHTHTHTYTHTRIHAVTHSHTHIHTHTFTHTHSTCRNTKHAWSPESTTCGGGDSSVGLFFRKRHARLVQRANSAGTALRLLYEQSRCSSARMLEESARHRGRERRGGGACIIEPGSRRVEQNCCR